MDDFEKFKARTNQRLLVLEYFLLISVVLWAIALIPVLLAWESAYKRPQQSVVRELPLR